MPVEGTPAPSREFFELLPLFLGSGCSALVYEIVWFQSLQLVVGSSAISLAVLLTTFMGGMCLGSLLFPKLVSRQRHPLRVYALLELAIGGLAVGLYFALPWLEYVYVDTAGNAFRNVFFRASLAGVCLVPPTLLMGATLPAIARWFESDRVGTSRIGLFYSANILGAVIGCLLAGFYLLRVHDLWIATTVAVAINGIVGACGWLLSMRKKFAFDVRAGGAQKSVAQAGAGDVPSEAAIRSTDSGLEREGQRVHSSLCGRAAYLVIGLSGCSALGAEVLWTRELSLMLGASVYTFSLILAVFLAGLGLGSSLAVIVMRSVKDTTFALTMAQLAAAIGVAWAAWIMARSLPFWPIDPSLGKSPWVGFQLDIVRVLWSVFPASLCWGLSFPLALAVASQRQDPAALVAKVYAANTLGAIVGALAVTWLAIPILGVQHAQQLLLGICILSAFVMGIARWIEHRRGLAHDSTWLALAAAAIFFLCVLPGPPIGLAAYGRYLITWESAEPNYLYAGDGVSSSIAVSEFDGGPRNFHVSGKVVASSEPQDMRLQRMLGHLPALLCKEPKSVLIVGCGAGVTAGSFVVHPSVERIVICEIEPLIPAAAGKYFAEHNHAVMQDPRVEVVFDDARHFMLTNTEKFDVITSDPIHPWVKGAAALYSLEYYRLCQQHLNKGGVVTQWVPLYESSLPAVKSEIATFFEAFPNGTLWNNDSEGEGYDIVMLGVQAEGPPTLAPRDMDPPTIDLSALKTRLNREDHRAVVESLKTVQLGSPLMLMRCYGGRRRELEPWLQDADLNTDRNLRLQYLAGWALNSYLADSIRGSMRAHWSYPEDQFTGSNEQLAALRAWLDRENGTSITP